MAKRYPLGPAFPLKTRREWLDYLHSPAFCDPTHDLNKLTPSIRLGKKTIAELQQQSAEEYLEITVDTERKRCLGTPTMVELAERFFRTEADDDFLLLALPLMVSLFGCAQQVTHRLPSHRPLFRHLPKGRRHSRNTYFLPWHFTCKNTTAIQTEI